MTTMLKKRTLQFEVKDAEKGTVEAVFARFNEVDHDGDFTVAGAFEDGAEVVISHYGHGSWGSQLPCGKGVIRVTDADARLVGQFFLASDVGRNHFETVKAMGGLQQWSYGYDAIEYSFGDLAGQRVRYLKKLKVHEICPTLAGAGLATETVAVKSQDIDGGVTPAVRSAIEAEFLRFERTRLRLAGG